MSDSQSAHEQSNYRLGAAATQQMDRRRVLGSGVCLAGAVGLGAAAAGLARCLPREPLVWQIDPDLCIACRNCETHCVLDVSAVKAVQCFALCGYCDVCTGFFPTEDYELETGAENQLCPTGAIRRRFVEEQGGVRFFEYTIDEKLCIGCGKCVKGCRLMNGSLYLQVRHDLCVNCNECAIAVACPAQAFVRVPADRPNLLGQEAQAAVAALNERRKRSAGTAAGAVALLDRLAAAPGSGPPTAAQGAADLPQPLAVRLRLRRAQLIELRTTK